MSLLNKFFGIKKETPTVSNTPVTIMNETVDQDGYVHLPSAVETQLVRQGTN